MVIKKGENYYYLCAEMIKICYQRRLYVFVNLCNRNRDMAASIKMKYTTPSPGNYMYIKLICNSKYVLKER